MLGSPPRPARRSAFFRAREPTTSCPPYRRLTARKSTLARERSGAAVFCCPESLGRLQKSHNSTVTGSTESLIYVTFKFL